MRRQRDAQLAASEPKTVRDVRDDIDKVIRLVEAAHLAAESLESVALCQLLSVIAEQLRDAEEGLEACQPAIRKEAR